MTRNTTSQEHSMPSVAASARPPPDNATWQQIIDAYKTAKKGSDEHDTELFKRLASSNLSGIHIQYEIRQIPGKGRGMVSNGFVAKGTRVLDDRSGKFRTEKELRDFLALLPYEIAKDTVDWMGVDDDDDQEVVWVDFSDVCLLNHGFHKRSLKLWERMFPFLTWKKVTANLEAKERNGVWGMFACCDIQPGEELLCDYNLSGNYDHSLKWFDRLCDEYYPGETRRDELKRWAKAAKERS